jgi:hypothetical protein
MSAEDPRFLATTAQIETELPNGKKKYEYVRPRDMYRNGEITLKEALNRPAYWQSAPEPTEYAAVEAAQQKWAEKLGITPARWQERAWVGGGELTGLESPPEPFLRTLASRIHYTAQQMGVDPQIVLQKFVQGKIPLLSATGALLWYGAGNGTDAQDQTVPSPGAY